MQDNLIVIDKNELTNFIQEGGKFVIKASAEEAIIKLKEFKDYINAEWDKMLTQIAEKGLEIDPDFKGIIGDKIRASYRNTTSAYDYDRGHTEVATPFLKETKYFRVDTPKVDEYLDENGELPAGILEKTREKKLVLSFKDSEEIYE